MSKGSRRRSSWKRVVIPNANRRLLPIQKLNLQVIEDFRQFTPEPRKPKTVDARPARITVQPKNYGGISTRNNPLFTAFSEPHKVIICVRRKKRREVLHALKKTGKGSGKARRTTFSDIHC